MAVCLFLCVCVCVFTTKCISSFESCQIALLKHSSTNCACVCGCVDRQVVCIMRAMRPH